MELLSPAGSMESVTAAVQNGADAVYMGLGEFNARRGAKNFSEEEYASAISYCHLRGVKVYLTLNTLLTDRELGGAAALTLYKHGLDEKRLCACIVNLVGRGVPGTRPAQGFSPRAKKTY